MPRSNKAIVDAIAARMSLRPPQRRSLEILDRITELVPPRHGTDLEAALRAIQGKFPSVTDFDRTFPSLCFALATGVGKTRLMGAFIAYLRLAHGLSYFFVLAPNLTIYNKLIADFTPNTPKYVFRGISEFAADPPTLTTGESYERHIASGDDLFRTSVNIFNISKINIEVRGGQSPRIRSFREEIGESYFDYLSSLDDLVLIMDESHRYRGSAGVRVINEMNPVLGLELTATPFVEAGRQGPVRFRNVVFDYPLASAIKDEFVKNPVVVTREDFLPAGKSPETIEQIKIEDGVRLHESVKAELRAYSEETGAPLVKPLMLVIARDTAHATELVATFKTAFGGRYEDKVIQIDSSVREDAAVERLLKVERTDEPTEIIVHVNMLKEGWDVTNLYTIVPLRAASARVLVEQSIGRGLRLPYGRRTGVAAIDRLSIVAHDRFQEIVEDARRADSPFRLGELVLRGEQDGPAMATVVSDPLLLTRLGLGQRQPDLPEPSGFGEEQSGFASVEHEIVRAAYEVILELARDPVLLPTSKHLRQASIQSAIGSETERRIGVSSVAGGADFAAAVAEITDRYIELTIDVPLILSSLGGSNEPGFLPFSLDLSAVRYEAPNQTLWAAHLSTGKVDRIMAVTGTPETRALEDYVVSALVDFDDVSYDEHGELLYELAGEVVRHLLSTLPEPDARRILRLHQEEIAAIVHAQMQQHVPGLGTSERKFHVERGFTTLRPSLYTAPIGARLDFRVPPADKAGISRYVFAGFSRCLYPLQKFDADAERKLAVVLDRDALKWFRPARGQVAIPYAGNAGDSGYQPDFVAETEDRLFLLECKNAREMTDAQVVAKREAAANWCALATRHAAAHGGKPWSYLLIPHDRIAENMSLAGLARDFAVPSS